MSFLLRAFVAALAAPLLLWLLGLLQPRTLCQQVLDQASRLACLLVPGFAELQSVADDCERVAAGCRTVRAVRQACPLVPAGEKAAVTPAVRREALETCLRGIEELEGPCSVERGHLLEWLLLRAAGLLFASGERRKGREHYSRACSLAGPRGPSEDKDKGGEWQEEVELLRGAVAVELVLAKMASPELRRWTEIDVFQLMHLASWPGSPARSYMQSREDLWRMQKAAETPLGEGEAPSCSGPCAIPENSKICAGTLGIQLAPLGPAKAAAA